MLRVIAKTVFTFKFTYNSCAKLWGAGRWRVLSESVSQSFCGGLFNMFRRIKIGLTRS